MDPQEVGDGREITAKVNTAELIKDWEERAKQAREVQVVTLLGAKTDLGRVRENNEDKFEFFQPDDPDVLALKGSFYAVADGMGGHSAGQIASELALKTAIKAYYADSSPMVEESLKAALQQANAMIFDTARAVVERAGMGTTMTALVIRGEEAFIAQVGDSRCYRLRGGKISQITEDHSWVAEQVKRGGLTAEEAAMSPFRNVITRSLGNAPNVDVDVYSEELKIGDKFLLCSDGLSGEVKPDEMADAMKKSSPSQAAQDLVELALERGGRDNITVLILSVIDIAKCKGNEKRKGLGALFGRG
ncbi:MAG: Stp1/IreP family PP2C-type Ser/Thr phosphatase [Armatimonadota bacterium]